jgi:predicted transposase YbfD/YdcC
LVTVPRARLERFARDGVVVPSYDCLRRTAARIDADKMDEVLGAWAVTVRAGASGGGPLVVAADGKELRGAKNAGGRRVRLLAGLCHATGVVLGQVEVGEKTNEIPKVKDLLDQIGDVTGMVFTLDALHTQDATAELITSRGADYVFTVKRNQPGLLASMMAQPWDDAQTHTTVSKGHGRLSRWDTHSAAPNQWVHFPRAAQVARITRHRKTPTGDTTETRRYGGRRGCWLAVVLGGAAPAKS